MRSAQVFKAITRINMVLLMLFTLAFLVDLLYGDLSISNLAVFTVPFMVGLILNMLQFTVFRRLFDSLTRKGKYKVAMGSFVYLVILGSLPFILSGEAGPVTAFFESMAGFTTTGLSSFDPGNLIREAGHGLLFYRVAIQWVGGLFYLVFAFMFLSDISDVAKRSADRKIFSRIGLIPKLTSLLQNLTMIYGMFTLASFLAFYLSGMSIFDSVCLSLSTVSTGGFSSTGRMVPGGAGVHMIVLFFMMTAGVGYYVHMSVFSARGRSRTLFDTENIAYVILSLTFPVVVFIILLFDGVSVLGAAWKGAFSAISAMTTTGFEIAGSESWPDSYKILMLILMLIGGSSLSMASGLKIQRVIMLIKGFFNEVKRASHPNAVQSLRRGEGTYSDKALESANMLFFYFFGLLAISIMFVLIFKGPLFDVISLCVTSLSNSGMAFGQFSVPEGIESLNWAVKLMLILVMLLGRFEILLPLYIMSPGSYRFNG
ncbi:MAG: TrkH family potassium uptake protein [Thermoplasmatota archaeon]